MVQVSKVADSVLTYAGDALVVGANGVFPAELAALDALLNNALSASAAELKPLKTKVFTTLGKHPSKHIILINVGKTPDSIALRKAAAVSARVCRELGAKRAGTTLCLLPIGLPEERAQAVAEGTILGTYAYTKYKKADKALEFVNLLGADDGGMHKGIVIAKNVCWARDAVNESPSHKYPVIMERLVRDELQNLPITITTLGKKEMEALNMNAILAVNRASVHEPRMLVLDYAGKEGSPIALVGKGITFDTGGLSLKPADGMEDMKIDMAGAAAVVATIKTAAELKLPVSIKGFVTFTENMPGGDAYKPGDVITAMNKKTIEVLNTDAEGRVILADTLAYAETFNPSAIIDLATLTGACMVALGYAASGAMGTDDALMTKVIAAGKITDDRAWQLPLYDEYSEAIKSDIADIKNSVGRFVCPGAQAGAAFLKHFVEKTPWVHLDIAGPAAITKENHLSPKGATGAGVRLLVKLLEDWK